MRGKTIDILKEAMRTGKAVGAFNTSNLETTQAIARASKEESYPCIIQATKKTLEFVGAETLGAMVQAVIEQESGEEIPVGFHLDHGHSFGEAVKAIKIGMDSVMIDASQLDLEENICLTKQVVEHAHKHGVTVQAELGKVPYLGREDTSVNWDEVMTDPEEARRLVEETQVDALAVGIGNAHGFFRERPEPDWKRLEQIRKLIPDTPLILHGASDWDEKKVREAVKRGITCFNIDTDIRIAFITTLCKLTGTRYEFNDPRKIMGEVRNAVQQEIRRKIRIFAGKTAIL